MSVDHDLAPGVHAGVGATRTGELNRVPESPLESTGKGAGHCHHTLLEGEARYGAPR